MEVEMIGTYKSYDISHVEFYLNYLRDGSFG